MTMKIIIQKMIKRSALLILLVMAASHATAAFAAVDEIPRAPSTPDTPKNWMAPDYRIFAQQLVDELMAGHPEIMSITIHATPPGMDETVFSMVAGSFPDRIGNQSSPGDVISIVKGVTQVESKWGSPNWKKKVSIVLPLKDSQGNYLRAAMVVAFTTSEDDPRMDTDFMAPGVAIRDGLNSRIAGFDSLFEPAAE